MSAPSASLMLDSLMELDLQKPRIDRQRPDAPAAPSILGMRLFFAPFSSAALTNPRRTRPRFRRRADAVSERPS
jgi:hypothetical protein